MLSEELDWFELEHAPHDRTGQSEREAAVRYPGHPDSMPTHYHIRAGVQWRMPARTRSFSFHPQSQCVREGGWTAAALISLLNGTEGTYLTQGGQKAALYALNPEKSASEESAKRTYFSRSALRNSYIHPSALMGQ